MRIDIIPNGFCIEVEDGKSEEELESIIHNIVNKERPDISEIGYDWEIVPELP